MFIIRHFNLVNYIVLLSFSTCKNLQNLTRFIHIGSDSVSSKALDEIELGEIDISDLGSANIGHLLSENLAFVGAHKRAFW